MSEIKQPQDHKPKKKDDPPKVEPYFTFTAAGQDYTMPNRTDDVITVGWVRRNRHLDEGDFLFEALEALADGDEDILGAIDQMTPRGKDWMKLQEDFAAHGGASKGE